MSGPIEPRQRQPVDDSLKVRLAIERYTPPMPEIRELATKYQRAEAVVSRAIISAFEQHLVEIRPVRQKEHVARRSDLEIALRSHFTNLLRAIVVDLPPSAPDFLHVKLGEALADEVQDQSRIRHRETIALGAGRSIYHFATRLCEHQLKLQAEEVAVVSLCGHSYPYHDSHNQEDGPRVPRENDYRNICLDADANVNQFSQAFAHRVRVAMASRPIFMGPSDATAHREYYGNLWSKRAPTLAISGVGIFNAEHQLVQLYESHRRKELFPHVILTPDLERRILDLHNTCSAMSAVIPTLGYSPVAEIGMWLYFVEPLPVAAPPEALKLADQIRILIAEINGLLFAPRFCHLQQIPAITLIAGGAEKANAIRCLLDTFGQKAAPEKRLALDSLCTDRTCAEMLLE